jgi:hypothetical protein
MLFVKQQWMRGEVIQVMDPKGRAGLVNLKGLTINEPTGNLGLWRLGFLVHCLPSALEMAVETPASRALMIPMRDTDTMRLSLKK